MTPLPKRHRVVLDCDTGIDDAVAIAYAAIEPSIDLVAVGTTWGNVDVERTTTNSLHILDLAGAAHVPVARGEAGPIDGSAAPDARHVHGEDGLGGTGPRSVERAAVDRSAAEQLVELCHAHPGELDVVAVGPLTNIAVALDLEPSLPHLARSLTVMGGAALAPGNITPAAEANFYFDPAAAERVLCSGWRTTIVPLDATMQVRLTERHRQQLSEAKHPLPRGLAAALGHYFAFYEEHLGSREVAMHDALAVAVATGRIGVRSAADVDTHVDTSNGIARGASICDLRRSRLPDRSPSDANSRVILEVEPGFPDCLTEVLVSRPVRTGHAVDGSRRDQRDGV